MDFEKNSELLKALGHPIRLQIVCGLLKGDGCNVNKIVNTLKLPQSTISQHLKTLKTAGIITPRKEGVKVCYAVTDKKAQAIANLF